MQICMCVRTCMCVCVCMFVHPRGHIRCNLNIIPAGYQLRIMAVAFNIVDGHGPGNETHRQSQPIPRLEVNIVAKGVLCAVAMISRFSAKSECVIQVSKHLN